MTKTKADIVTGACRELGIAPVEQDIDNGPYAVVEGVYESVFLELQAAEVIAWPITATPDECANALEVYIAQRAVNRAPTDEETRAYLIGLGRKPYIDFVAAAGRRWNSSASTNADRF